jgi:hypothetical protein
MLLRDNVIDLETQFGKVRWKMTVFAPGLRTQPYALLQGTIHKAYAAPTCLSEILAFAFNISNKRPACL